ncbi:hypothetical protein OYC64_012664 [Pagothenia borchgrevinki]|uniref:Uncharacterized protein n=1 Tax=Pagothenia borchgrevinki TaxID=8213 RepID=A0ABD2G9P1_PAGBO
MLEIFYQSVVASALFFAAVCWGGSIRDSDTSRINKLIRKAGSVIGIKLDPFEAVVERRTLNRLLSIMDNPTHPLHLQLDSQRSSFSNRLLQLPCHKDRYWKTFLPTPITLYNKSPLAGRELSAP